MFLSIIIPHFNSPDSLKILLESILNAKRNNIQIIVVDDNSDKYIDTYNSVVEEYSLRNVLFTKNESVVHSAGRCRNIGLGLCTGDWVLFADADDYFLDGWYDKVESFFESESDVIFFTPTSINVDTGLIDTRHIIYSNLISNYLEKPSIKQELNLRYRFYSPWCKLLNMRFLKENNISFQESIVSNDVRFTTLVGLYAKKISCSTEIIYCITKHNGSLTTKKNRERSRIRARISVETKLLIYNNETAENKKNYFFPGYWFFLLVSLLIKNKDLGLFFELLQVIHKGKKN